MVLFYTTYMNSYWNKLILYLYLSISFILQKNNFKNYIFLRWQKLYYNVTFYVFLQKNLNNQLVIYDTSFYYYKNYIYQTHIFLLKLLNFSNLIILYLFYYHRFQFIYLNIYNQILIINHPIYFQYLNLYYGCVKTQLIRKWFFINNSFI